MINLNIQLNPGFKRTLNEVGLFNITKLFTSEV